MKKKKIIIISIIVALVLAAGVTTFFVLKDKDKKDDKKTTSPKTKETITITFDADGGKEVEPMKVKKGEKFKLPETEKKGYFFQGWYDGKTFYFDEDTDKIDKDITLKAYWANPDTPEEDEELKVTFDSNGGSKVKDMTFKCTDGAATIKNLPKSKKDSYEFLSWEDKHGKSILDGAKVICDGTSLKLYAVWEYDGPVANPEQDPNASKTYKCPDGFEITSDNKCVSKKSPEYYCDNGFKNSTVDNTVCYKYVKDPDDVKCKDGRYHYTQTSTSGSTIHFCATELASYTGSKTMCKNNGGHLLSNSHCVKNVEQVGNSKLTFTCTNSIFREGKALASGEKDGCYELKQRDYGCKNAGEGYSMNHTYGKCVKTVDATLE